jgi:hypothetical protein
MMKTRVLALAILGAAFSTPSIYSQDLSRYRDFQFGTSLPAVAKQVDLKPSEAIAIHQRPALIQELAWGSGSRTTSLPRYDSIKDILFSFYNGELFRIVVTYDPDRIAGMTAEDIIEAVSVKYGTATMPAAQIILSSTQFFSDGEKLISYRSEKVIARWEDLQFSYNLINPSYQSTFGIIIYAKGLDTLARAAIIESIRLDDQEAPQRKIERQKKKDTEDRAQQEKARRMNKAPFRP